MTSGIRGRELVRRGRDVPTDPAASIVICVMERVGDLTRCLRSLTAMPAAPAHEVVVVGNGTPESLLQGLPSPERLVVVSSRVNLGFGGGCNWGARFSRGRHLVFLNDDTEVEPGWLGALVAVAESDPRVGGVGSRLLDLDGTLQEAGSILWSDGGTHHVGRGLPPGSTAYDRVRDVDYCSACGLLVTRAAWEAVGGFDERYFPAYHEDVDLCLSVHAAGYRIVYVPEARLRHRRGGSLPEEVRGLVGARSGRRFIAKWGDLLRDFEPHPDPASLEAAVPAAVARAERRPLPPLRVAAPQTPLGPPTAAEAGEVRSRAVAAARELQEEIRREMRRRRRERRRRRLRWLAARLGLRRRRPPDPAQPEEEPGTAERGSYLTGTSPRRRR